MSRTLVHYSTKELTSANLHPITNIQRKLHYVGKPSGLWYAYEDTWKEYVDKDLFKHVFTVPESAFISDVSDTSDSILILNAAVFDGFMTRFHRPEYIRTPKSIIEHGFRELQAAGGSHILDEIAVSNESFGRYIEILTEDERFIEGDPTSIINRAIKRFNLLSVPISDAALARDSFNRYDWPAFWRSVGQVFGGIEFMPDIFGINEWRGMPITWTSKLDVHSGVIFNPATFRGGVMIAVQKAGQRRTGKSMRKRKNLTRRRGRSTKQ